MICPHCNGTGEVDAPDEAKKLTQMEIRGQWFEDFWCLYPRKVSKLSAARAFKRAATSEAIKDAIMEAVRGAWWGKDKQFIPHASTWLNGRRWEDEQAQTKPAARVIQCEKCGDSGIKQLRHGWARCVCVLGKAPGLLIPQADVNDPGPF
jgi:hypothetical protein